MRIVFIKPLFLISVICVLGIVGLFYYQSVSKPKLLSEYLTLLEPRFIDEKKKPSLDVTQTATSLRPFFNIDSTDDQSTIQVIAIGKRYVLARAIRPTDHIENAAVFDTQQKRFSAFVEGQYAFHTKKAAVFVSPKSICTYRLDSAACILLPNSTLGQNEYYGDDSGAGGFMDLIFTHSEESMTIAIFQNVNDVSGACTDCKVMKKVREATYRLPL